MEISDIQEKRGKVQITFCDDGYEDIMDLILSEEDCWAIHKFCREVLSFGAKRKKKEILKNGL